MSYIKMEHRVLNDPRILDLSPHAFTVHVYALDWCNEQATDGLIPAKVAHRMMCQLDPVEIVDAFKELVESGLWTTSEDGYECPEFLAYGLEGDEQRTTRDKWSQSKRRRRLHGVGNHALCLPEACAAKKAQGTTSTDGVDSTPLWGGRLDPTRLDQTHKGSGRESPGRPARADAQPPPGLVVDIDVTSSDDGHAKIFIAAPTAEHDRATFEQLTAYNTNRILEGIEALREKHNCDGEHGCSADVTDEAIVVCVPEALGDQWAQALVNWFSAPGRAAA